LVELDLFVLSFIQNYDLLKCYSINLKNTVKNVSGSNRQKKIRTFSSDSASAKKFDVLIKKKSVSNDYNSLKSGMTAISFYSALLELEHSVPVQPQLKNLTFL